MKPVEFSPMAKADLENIGDTIAEDNPRRAVSFIRELREQAKKLGDFPEAAPRFPALGETARFVPYGSYIILYNNLTDIVRIERILHGPRDILALIEDD